MNAFVIFAVAKQQDGNFCVAKPEAAFWEEDQATQALLKSSVVSTELVPTEYGKIPCDVERAVFKIVLPELPERSGAVHFPNWSQIQVSSKPLATTIPPSIEEGGYELLTPQ